MKKVISVLISAILLLNSTVFAVGETNLDSGGGTINSGTESSYWSTGNEGVRITVIRASDYEVITVPIDILSATPPTNIYHFGKVSKVSYVNGFSLNAVRGGYVYKTAEQALPTIISSSGNNIEEIKSYFTDEQVIRVVSETTGMSYENLISGNYKLLIEPIVFFKFYGVDILLTATEAAMYDELINGSLKSNMASLSHKNLPLSMFLETSDLGFSAWNGSTTTSATNAQIKANLGLGVVRFEEEPEITETSDYDYEYRIDTEVITSVYVYGGQSDPDDDTVVTFNIDGTKYTVSNVYYPSGDGQLVWVKWTTPSTPQDIVIDVSVSGPGDVDSSKIYCSIVDLDENPPLNPVADDRNDDFEYAIAPSRDVLTTATWGIWTTWWQENWVDNGGWEYDKYTDGNGVEQKDKYWDSDWEDEGWWAFDYNEYSASLSATTEITCDSENPTANSDTMKSGYGINQLVETSVRTTQNSATTDCQNVVSYFSEFNYETYWRLLEQTSNGEFEFQKNVYSTYKNRTHFTPIWVRP
ncbi:MAG: hypothetical protein R3Y09_13010 [Clostridia bacterium]